MTPLTPEAGQAHTFLRVPCVQVGGSYTLVEPLTEPLNDLMEQSPLTTHVKKTYTSVMLCHLDFGVVTIE